MTRIDRRAFMAVSAASAAVIGAGSRVQAKEAGWTARASLPWMAQEIYAAVHEGKIVTAGGLVMRRGQPLHVEDPSAPTIRRRTPGANCRACRRPGTIR